MQNLHIVHLKSLINCTIADKPNMIIAIANKLSCRNSEFIIPNNINAEITCNIF